MPVDAQVLLRSGGQLVSVSSRLPAIRRELLAAAGGSTAIDRSTTTHRTTVRLRVDRPGVVRTGPLCPVARGVWADSAGNAVVDSAGGSGYRQWWSTNDEVRVHSTWSPTSRERAAAALLPTRRRALDAQVLLHYPVMWRSVLAGMAPLHASVVEVGGLPVLLAGPGGVGKSTLVAGELARGSRATCDNLAVSDGVTAHGLAEPLRLTAVTGTRTTHGRREHPWTERVACLRPRLVVVVRRGTGARPSVRSLAPASAARALVAGTFAAGELQRFWVLAAQLATATGRGPAVPPVEAIAGILTHRLPCLELVLADRPGPGLGSLLAGPLADIGTEEVHR